MITRQEWKQLMEDEDNLWALGSQMTTLKTGSPNASTATNTVIWQKNAKLENVSNAKRKDILQRTAREHS